MSWLEYASNTLHWYACLAVGVTVGIEHKYCSLKGVKLKRGLINTDLFSSISYSDNVNVNVFNCGLNLRSSIFEYNKMVIIVGLSFQRGTINS